MTNTLNKSTSQLDRPDYALYERHLALYHFKHGPLNDPLLCYTNIDYFSCLGKRRANTIKERS